MRRLFFGDVTPNLPKENPFHQQETVISGRRLITRDEAEQMADIETTDAGLSFGGVRVGSETNIIICGQTRSGKTTLLKQMMAKALLRVKKGSDERAIIYDATGEFIPFVHAVIGDDAPVIIFDPEDERGVSWDVSADITTPAQAQNLTEILIPKEEGDEPFFIGGAQSVTKAVLESFLLRTAAAREQGENFSWTLRDLFNALATKEAAIAVLRSFTGNTIKSFEHEIKLYLERNNNDILSTIATKSSKARLVAAMWDERPSISIKDFVENTDGKVIVITSSNESSSIVKELNRLFIERLSQTLLDTKSLSRKRTHIFLDEFTELGKLDALKKLLKLGLKKGVRVYLCYQNFEEVKEVYGEHQAEVILSESGTIAFLWQKGKSAAAAAEFIGKQIVIITNKSTGSSSGEQGSTMQRTDAETQVERWTVEPEAFSNRLPLAGKKNGVAGFFFSPSVRDVWSHRFEWRELERFATAKSDNPAHEPKKPRQGIAYQFLKTWANEEQRKFELSHDAKKKEPQQEEHSQTAQGAPVTEQEEQEQSAPVIGAAFNLEEYTGGLKEKFFNRDEFIASVQRHEQERGN